MYAIISLIEELSGKGLGISWKTHIKVGNLNYWNWLKQYEFNKPFIFAISFIKIFVSDFWPFLFIFCQLGIFF